METTSLALNENEKLHFQCSANKLTALGSTGTIARLVGQLVLTNKSVVFLAESVMMSADYDCINIVEIYRGKVVSFRCNSPINPSLTVELLQVNEMLVILSCLFYLSGLNIRIVDSEGMSYGLSPGSQDQTLDANATPIERRPIINAETIQRRFDELEKRIMTPDNPIDSRAKKRDLKSGQLGFVVAVNSLPGDDSQMSLPSPSACAIPATPTSSPIRREPAPAPQKTWGKARWIPYSSSISINGYEIPHGLFYVGDFMQYRSEYASEPSLIMPTLNVTNVRDYGAFGILSSWPSYASLSTAQKGVYLWWHATGRRDPRIDIGYVFIFFYGLERRVLLDLWKIKDSDAEQDFVAIQTELDELIHVYKEYRSFVASVEKLSSLIAARMGKVPVGKCAKPIDVPFGLDLPIMVRLGQEAVNHNLVPPDLCCDIGIAACLITDKKCTTTFCAPELYSLFESKYAKLYPNGHKFNSRKRNLRVEYRPAGMNLTYTELEIPCTPHVNVKFPQITELSNLAATCMDILYDYAKWKQKNPNRIPTPEALFLLPSNIVKSADNALSSFADLILGASDQYRIFDVPQLTGLWSGGSVEKLGSQSRERLCRYFEQLEIASEPDIEAAFSAGQGNVVLFTSHEAAQAALTESQRRLLLLAASLLDIAGRLHNESLLLSASQIVAREWNVGNGMGQRIYAHFKWLSCNGPLPHVTKRIVAKIEEKESATAVLVLSQVSKLGGAITPESMKFLCRFCDWFGYPSSSVARLIHDQGASEGEYDNLAIVRDGSPDFDRYTIPIRQVQPRIDETVLGVKRAETDEVSKLLGKIFEEVVDSDILTVVQIAPAAKHPSGLDEPHLELVRILATRPSWLEAEWIEIAKELQIMPMGAIERINEAALEKCDEIMCDGDDNIEVDRTIAEELLTWR
jgi:hypothetical protein